MPRRLALALTASVSLVVPRASSLAETRPHPRAHATHAARPTQSTYNGRAQQLNVAPPRLAEQGSEVDGVLTEAQWAQASVLTGFSEFEPSDGIPANDSTEVLVWYSPTAIHFGIRAFETHGAPHATLANRDNIGTDDQIHLLIDTFDDHQRALLFAVNPFGVQMDGVMNDGAPGKITLDMSPDYVFQSKGRVTTNGYEVEIRIPFKSLKYQSAESQRWGFNVMRIVQHSGHEQSWAPARRASSTLLGQSGRLEGLSGLDRGVVLDFTPELTQRTDGAPAPQPLGVPRDGSWQYDAQRPAVGATLRYGVTNNLTLGVTAHPDFSQVESDAGNFNPDPRYALSFEEKRPFFLDGRESFARSFRAPYDLIYSRRIVQPDAAAKLSGKVGATSVGFLSAVDGTLASATGNTHPVFNILRVRQELSSATLGMTYTDRVDDSRVNRVGAVDARLRFGGLYTAYGEVAHSWTGNSTGWTAAPLWSAGLERSGRTVQTRSMFLGISPRFKAQSGFVQRPGVVTASSGMTIMSHGDAGSLVELASISPSTEWNWGYDGFFEHRDALEKKAHLDAALRFRGGWHAGAGVYLETFGFDPSFYSGYQVQGPTGPQPFNPMPRIGNIDKVLSLDTPSWQRFSASGMFIWGNDEDFLEWAPANIALGMYSAEVRPTETVRIGASYIMQRNVRRSDGSVSMLTRIPRLKLEYQLARSLSVRLVGEYDDFYHDALRDEAGTGAPLIIDGTLAGASQSSSFAGQGLLSYQPSPGTVLFVGYGASYLDELAAGDAPVSPRTITRAALARQRDAFFVKASYLLRM